MYKVLFSNFVVPPTVAIKKFAVVDHSFQKFTFLAKTLLCAGLVLP